MPSGKCLPTLRAAAGSRETLAKLSGVLIRRGFMDGKRGRIYVSPSRAREVAGTR